MNDSLGAICQPYYLSSDSPILKEIPFRKVRYHQIRHAYQFLPGPSAPQEMVIHTSWGGELTAQAGDFIVHPLDDPDNLWPVSKDIFLETYQAVGSGAFQKKSVTEIIALDQITQDPDRLVIVKSLEGDLKVRSGDFYLARGSQGEIWPIPIKSCDAIISEIGGAPF